MKGCKVGLGSPTKRDGTVMIAVASTDVASANTIATQKKKDARYRYAGFITVSLAIINKRMLPCRSSQHPPTLLSLIGLCLLLFPREENVSQHPLL